MPKKSLGDALATPASRNRVRAIVVESSGPADPAASIELLHEPSLAARVRLQGVITVVNAEATARPGLDGVDAGLWRAQIRFANWLLLSQCDRLSPEEVARAETTVRRLNPHARRFRLPLSPAGMRAGTVGLLERRRQQRQRRTGTDARTTERAAKAAMKARSTRPMTP